MSNTDAPRVSENVIRQLRFIIADQLSIHRDLVTQPMTLKTPSWEALRDMCDELLALRTPNEHGSALAQETGPQPAEPVSKSVAKRIAAQKGEPYPFTAEPVCGYASYRNHKCALPSGHQGDHNSRADGTGSFWGTDPDDEPLKPDCSPTGLTREEVEALEASIAVWGPNGRSFREAGYEALADKCEQRVKALRNLAARK
jgi:hypothetical protein